MPNLANNLGIITLLSRIISHNLRSFVKKKIYIYIIKGQTDDEK